MKTLIFDADKSLSSIGGPDVIEKHFGFAPVAVNSGLEELGRFFASLIEPRNVKVQHPLFEGVETTETVFALRESVKAQGIEAIVIDSISVVGYQERVRMTKAANAVNMDLQMWGIYGEKLMRFIHMLSRLDIPVIVTCHVDRSQDENGGPIEIPGVKGSAKMEMARFFDVVAYTIVEHGKKGQSTFSWQINADGRRSQAKSRLAYPSEFGKIPQDFGALLKHYRDGGIEAPKFLIIGDAGHGKTRSLLTLAQA